MLHRSLTVAALGGLLFVGGLAMGGAVTDPLTALVDELEHRRDDDLSGSLDKAGKKQLKAIKKSLKTIDKAGDDLKKCAKAGGKVATTLEKAYPSDLGPAESHIFELRELVEDWLAELEDEIVACLDEVDFAYDGLSAKGQSKVDKQLGKAEDALDLADGATTYKDWGKGLAKAAAAAVKAKKIAAKDGGSSGGGPDVVTATVNDAPYTATTQSAEVCGNLGPSGLQIFATQRVPQGTDVVIYLWHPGVDGPGGFSFEDQGTEGNLQESPNGQIAQPTIFTINSGAINVTTYDPPNLVEGTFTVVAGDGEIGFRNVVNGVFRISGDNISLNVCD